jgi:hypothetical protein
MRRHLRAAAGRRRLQADLRVAHLPQEVNQALRAEAAHQHAQAGHRHRREPVAAARPSGLETSLLRAACRSC